MTRPSSAEYFTGSVRIDPLFEAKDPARARRLCHVRAAALSNAEVLTHCAAIALCRARKTYF